MALQVETTTNIDPLTAALEAATKLQNVTEDDLHELRRLLYQSTPLSSAQVDRIFDAHREMPAKDGLWLEFFLEALTDTFLARHGDQIYVKDAAEHRLFEAMGSGGPVMDPGYRHLVLRLLFCTTKAPERYRRLVFDMVHYHIMHDGRRLLIDLPRQAGTIDIVDLQLIRKLVFGAGGQYERAIDRVVADFLLELDQTSITMIDQEAWRHLLFKAISFHIGASAPEEDHAGDGIDNDASNWLVEQIKAGRSGRNTIALIRHLIDNANAVSPSLQALAADSE